MSTVYVTAKRGEKVTKIFFVQSPFTPTPSKKKKKKKKK